MALDVVTVGVVCADVMVKPVDAFPERGKLTVVPQLEIHLGGPAAVTAAVLCRFGASAGFIGKVGEDGFADYVRARLKRDGVNVEHVTTDPAHGSAATVVLVGSDGERTFLHQVGANAAISEDDIDLDFVKQAKVFHWGGPAITPGLDGPPMGRIMKKVRAMGVKTSMDTVYDGKGIWYPHIEPALPHLDLVMSSLEEARHYTGKQTPEEIADFFLSFGAETAVIKLGHEGVFLKNCEGTALRLPAYNVTPVDTTGAGDAACGGFLYGYINGWDLERCGRLGNAAGGLTVQAMGGGEGVESLEAALAFMEQTELKAE